MWRIGGRKLPIGMQFAGGSDWFCLNNKFVNYVVNSKDEYLENLKIYFNYTLLPSEVLIKNLYIFNFFLIKNFILI